MVNTKINIFIYCDVIIICRFCFEGREGHSIHDFKTQMKFYILVLLLNFFDNREF